VQLKNLMGLAARGEMVGVPAILELSKELRMLWARFGMTPADRSRVKVEKPQKPEGKLGRHVG
jgi:hypothetical protein